MAFSTNSWINNYYWINTAVVLWASMSVIVLCMLIVEIRTFYRQFYQAPSRNIELHQMKSHSDSSLKKVESLTEEHKKKKKKLVYILPIISYLFYIIFGFLSVFFKLNLIIFSGCKYGEYMGVIFTLGKLFMYFVFIWRLYIVYTDSTFAYNTAILTIMIIIIILWGFGNAILNVFTTKSVILISEKRIYCTIDMYMPMVGSTVLYDLITCSICCYLFIRPLLWMIKNNQNNETMYTLIVKYTILTFVAVISTFIIFIAVGVTDLAGLVAIDVTINSFCIFLFNNKYNNFYNCICCGAIKSGTKCIHCCCNIQSK
eukprot:535234_1